MSMSILLGNAVGAQFPNFFIDDDASGSKGLEQVYKMLLFMAILGSSLILPSFIFFKGKPAHLPRYNTSYLHSLNLTFKAKQQKQRNTRMLNR